MTDDERNALRERVTTGQYQRCSRGNLQSTGHPLKDARALLAEVDRLRAERAEIVSRYWSAVAWSERCPECGAVLVSGATWKREPHRCDCLFVGFAPEEAPDG